MLWVLPLEPLPERYTEQWWRWFVKSFQSHAIDYRMIDGHTLTQSVETGLVLDAAGTNFWKFSQLMHVCELFHTRQVKDGDKFFTMDMWHPGLEAIPYMACLYNVDIFIYAFLHAGSYTLEDFAEPMSRWAADFEIGWARICDKIFVGSEYHRAEFIKQRLSHGRYRSSSPKVIVTGNPFDSSEVSKWVTKPVEARKRIVIFPHRWDKEKHPEKFIRIMNDVWDRNIQFRAIISTGRQKLNDQYEYLSQARFPYEVRTGLSKKAYYESLAEARVMVSTAVDEHFGYCTAEAIAAGCAVVVPNKWSYPELLSHDSRFLYSSYLDAADSISGFLENPVPVPFYYVQKYDRSVDRIIDEMQGMRGNCQP